jgi:hypothetical protein
LTSAEVARIENARDWVSTSVPKWNALLAVDVEVLSSDSAAFIGSSNASIPQTIVLGKTAWHTDEELREQLLHEIAHIWLYMIEELWPLHYPASGQRYTLPSGTAGKTITGVLNAGFVAQVLCEWYSSHAGDSYQRRASELKNYCVSCVELLQDCNDLTSVGEEIYHAIRSANMRHSICLR